MFPRPRSSRTKGSVAAGASTEIVVYATATKIGAFEEELCIETERMGLRYFFKVRGDAQQSILDSSKSFRDVNFGSCLVGEEARRVLEVENLGGYPLEFEIKTNYPVRVTPLKGAVPGHGRQQFVVSWTPTGGYKMKATVHCYTPQKVYDFVCKGLGAYPRFVLRNNHVDFGVGAVGVEYVRQFQVINKGQLSLSWRVPPIACEAFRVEPSSGVLRPNEESSVRVLFKPLRVGQLYQSEPVLESKGRHRDVSKTLCHLLWCERV